MEVQQKRAHMFTRDPDASFDTPNVVIGRQDRNELTLSFRPDPYLSTLLLICRSRRHLQVAAPVQGCSNSRIAYSCSGTLARLFK